jgi:heat shock protein HslJ
MSRLSRRTLLAAALFGAASTAAACVLPPMPVLDTSPGLAGTSWVVTRISDLAVPDGTYVSLEFGADGMLSGIAGCNRYRADYSQTGSTLSIGMVMTTRRTCDPAIGWVEAALLDALPLITTIEAEPDGTVTAFLIQDGTRITARPRILR